MRQFQQEIARLQSELSTRSAAPAAQPPPAADAAYADATAVRIGSDAHLAAVKEAMRVELEAQLRQELTGDALAAARAEVEATARQEVRCCSMRRRGLHKS